MSSATAVEEAPQSAAGGVFVSFDEPIDEQIVSAVQDDLQISLAMDVDEPTEIIDLRDEQEEKDHGYSYGVGLDVGQTASSAVNLVIESSRVPRPVPLSPKVSQGARQWLTGDLRLINQQVAQFCIAEARHMHVPINELRLSVKRSREGEFSELVLQVFVEANLPQSLALWDAIGDVIQTWGQKQGPRIRRLLEEQYAVFVEPI